MISHAMSGNALTQLSTTHFLPAPPVENTQPQLP
jgi:hypothetical protein